MMMKYYEELGTLIKVWFVAILCIYYCYLIPIRIKHGMSRLLSLLPVITIFFILPLPFSTIHFLFVVFYHLNYMARYFQTLTLGVQSWPFSYHLALTLVFVSVAMLPIDLKNLPNKKIADPASAPAPTPTHKPLILAFKALTLNIIVYFYKYKHKLHLNIVILVLYKWYMFLSIELGLAINAFFLMMFLGFDLETEPQFNEPLLATSLQDFWGRRWNLVSSRNLRAAVYNPTRELLPPIVGKLRSQQLAICVTFLVSGLMHELLFLYITRVQPTWEVTWFFVLQGVCTAGEVGVKKTVAAGRLGSMHRAVSWHAYDVVYDGYC